MSPVDPSRYDWREHRSRWSDAVALVLIMLALGLGAVVLRSLA